MTGAHKSVSSVVSCSAEDQNGCRRFGSDGGGEYGSRALHALGRGDAVIIRVFINDTHRLR